ncbi:PREDICTED: cell death abnormality protein 1-like [Polistes canadensis]|uniref:cell death abnormality protein 1-like n=1 Tax=Polistes canadensis TaxID=91411 RepID=UPI00071904A1|nr:PREDICTED: cell death abnormality protein 1-like [Polistes canadensis]
MPGVCARCHREVYFAEERLALGKVWHTFCFSCFNCRKLLDSCTVSTHRGELFCRNCYSRLFPTILRSSKENISSKEIKIFPCATIPNTSISLNDSTCCYCCCCCATEDSSIGETSSINNKDYHLKKSRLRGGGEEEEKSQSRYKLLCISSTEGNHKNPINNSSTPRPCPRLSVRRVSFCEEKNIVDCHRDMQNDCRVFLEDRNFDDSSNVDILTIRSFEDVRKLDQDLNDEDLNYSDTVNCTQISCNDNTLVRKHNDNNIDKDMPNCIHRNLHDSLNNIEDKNEEDEDDRMRGGHGGNNCRKSKKVEGCCASKAISEECGCFSCQNVENKGCGYRKRCLEFQSCPSREYDPCLDNHKSASCKSASCSPPCIDRRGCPPPGCRPVCRKPRRSCCSPCKGELPSCGGGGCCGSGCSGGCGKPGQTCMPARPCSTSPCRSFPPCIETTCTSPRPCNPTSPCCRPPSGGGCCSGGGGSSYCRSRSSPCRTILSGGCCCDNVTCCDIDRADSCCKAKLPSGCECLGGGLNCQRCGRKVYQAEMQIASGVPYHNICFSCFCCRKPLEPLTYQENCGEIYCKQCYIRNFGPQGYGYGMGAGALQTPM